jgi:hypothetical protein
MTHTERMRALGNVVANVNHAPRSLQSPKPRLSFRAWLKGWRTWGTEDLTCDGTEGEM